MIKVNVMNMSNVSFVGDNTFEYNGFKFGVDAYLEQIGEYDHSALLSWDVHGIDLWGMGGRVNSFNQCIQLIDIINKLKNTIEPGDHLNNNFIVDHIKDNMVFNSIKHNNMSHSVSILLFYKSFNYDIDINMFVKHEDNVYEIFDVVRNKFQYNIIVNANECKLTYRHCVIDSHKRNITINDNITFNTLEDTISYINVLRSEYHE